MKKIIFFVIFVILLTLISCAPKKENLTGDVQVTKPLNEKTFQYSPKLLKLDSSKDVLPDNIKSLGFNKCVIQSEGIRIDNNKFQTNNVRKNNLRKQTTLLEEKKIPYYIEVISGPGISTDRKNLSLYTNKDNVVFFSQMIKETVDMHKNSPHFRGIILSIGSSSINKDVYYDTLKKISDRVSKASNVPFILTLHSSYIESEDNDLPLDYFTNLNVGFNIDMSLNFHKYPGNMTVNNKEVSISKNTILEKLIKTKKSNTEDNKRQVMVSLKYPWESEGTVLLKDIFEIMQMIDFDFSFSYGNTKDSFDFSGNKDINAIFSKY